jgi:LCP family protein required for cell wall assembly
VIRRNRGQATLTARGRRQRASTRREDMLRAQGIDPAAYEASAGTSGTAAATRRRGPSIKAIFLIALLLIAVIAVIGGILLWQRVSKFNDSVSTASAASSALWGPLGGTERVNIALFGYGGKEHHAGNYLADSIQILSIDPDVNQTTVIPVPRDFWIEGLPELPDNGKINEVFASGYDQGGGIEGAAKLTTKVLSKVTGLKIDHWMAIDFGGFKEMVDAVGGVDVKNRRFFRYTWSPWVFEHDAFEENNPDLEFERGLIHLDGDQALAYARARYTSLQSESSDFARSERQQRVLAALRAKLGAGGIGSLGPGLAMMDALELRMKTDLSAIDLALVSSHFSPDRRLTMKEGRVLEATTNTNGSYILVVVGRDGPGDYSPLQHYIRQELRRLSSAAERQASASPS